MNLVIDRKTWARGGTNGYSALLNVLGNKCCLGFFALKCGYTPGQIQEKGTLSTLANTSGMNSSLSELLMKIGEGDFQEFYQEADLSCSLMSANDSSKLSEEERETLIIREFEKVGVQVQFV